jgi:deoxyadenosine/deoxycytidine kinase
VRTLRQRIRNRGRSMEQDMPLAYLKLLDHLYEDWFSRYNQGEVLVIESGQLDYVSDLVDRQDLHERIEALLPSTLARQY